MSSFIEHQNGVKYTDIINFEEGRIEFYDTCLNETDNHANATECLDFISKLSRAVDIAVSFVMKKNIG